MRWKGQNQRAGLKLIVAEGCWGASWGGSAAHSQVGSTPGRTCPALSGPRPVCSVSSEGHRGCPCPRALSWLRGRCLLWGGSRGVWLQPGLFLLLLKPWWARCCSRRGEAPQKHHGVFTRLPKGVPMQQDHPPAPSFSPLASPWPEGGRLRRSETRSWGWWWQDGTPMAHPWAFGDPPGLGELDRDPPPQSWHRRYFTRPRQWVFDAISRRDER